ncbi:Conserved repeat domain protein, partial [hydrothermal vent metagenome]
NAVPTQGAITGVREIYGPSNLALSTPALDTPSPSPLEKANQNPITDLTRSIGVPFNYVISVPETPQATALYDVRILDVLDDLSPNVDLIFVDVQKVSVGGTWLPVNTGPSATNLVIADAATGTGIDIPAGEQAVINLSVVLRNSSNNVAGDVFTNSADYTFNSADNDNGSQIPGGTDSDAALTVVEPTTMTLQKTGTGGTGAPTNRVVMQFGVPETFTLNMQNTGTGPAFDVTITDLLSNPITGGGMCDNAPTVVSAQVFAADGVTPVSIPLIENTHFTTAYAGPPNCTFTITTTAPEAEVPSLNRLIITYDALLDVDNVNNAVIENVAGVTRWFSADTPAGIVTGEIREYTAEITVAAPGTPGTLDDEDVAQIQIAAPQLVIEKRAFNPVSGAQAFTAEPDEDVRYEITITNIGPVAANNFSLTDEPDRLNNGGAGYFVSGSMANINVSLAADTTNTNINAGANAAGILDVRNLNLSNLATGNNVVTINFEMTLQGVIDSGTFVENQALTALAGFNTLLSDDPDLSGANNPTRIIIGSIPIFNLLKTSQDITGDVNVLDAGDILRYTITAQNIGAENSINTLLRDLVPANTSYVANSTTLNGISVADAANGVSPLRDGILINAPGGAAGTMQANSTSTNNVATITFDVLLDANVVNSTVISNQAFVGGDGVGSGPYSEQPSDDPDTDILGDPTRDVVGNVAIIDAQKTVELIIDNGTADQVDPGDTLRYTITINNAGTIAATDVELQDNVPANTTYVANSTTLNGLAVADIALNSPLIPGIAVSGADLTPPLPAANAGTINPQRAATITFDVTINAGTADGTIIRNQGRVSSAEFPDELTDEDGNDINGDQPTDIVVGSAQQLSISKDVFVVGGGTAQPGATLSYVIQVENTGPSAINLAAASAEVLKLFDDVDQANLITYVTGSARLNGAINANVVYNAPRLIIEYDVSQQAISPNFMFEPGDKFTLRYLARIDAAATPGTNIVNTVAVDWGVQDFLPVNNTTPINCTGGAMNVDACATVSLAVGGAPGVATLSGNVWHDANLNELEENDERVLAGWEVEIYFGGGTINPGDYLDSVFTDANGVYTVQGLVPNEGDTLRYALRFRPPAASTDSASMGTVVSPFFSGNGAQTLTNFEVPQSSLTPAINLPLQPNGVIYDSVLRVPVAGAILQLVNTSGVIVPASCFVDATQQNQRTVANGYYKFELNFSQAECVSGADYTVNVFPPSGYFDDDSNPNTSIISAIIPPLIAITDAAFDAQTCANDPFPTAECEIQPVTSPPDGYRPELAPPISFAPRTPLTNYYQKFTFSSGATNQIFNNHIAVDPELENAISISKISALVNVTRGQLVPYTITLGNTLAAPIYDLDLTDLFPPGFKYIAGSGRMQIDNEPWVKIEPVSSQGLAAIPNTSITENIDFNEVVGVNNLAEFVDIARVLSWNNIGILRPNSTIRFKLLLVVGSGVGEGEYINRAIATNNQTTGAASGVASATVRVVPDPTFDCSDVIGKVFDDKNLNAYQDEGEEGLGDVRVLTARGLEITTDDYGRFHITCAVVPNPDRGSNFIIKLDERSLPSGYRLTTENPRVVRATRGKMVKFNFGAAIHRVVRLDMADAVFEPDTSEMRPQWLPRIDLLITELAKDPSLLRLSYLADNESESLVNERIQAVEDIIQERWEELDCCYQLAIETEVFWRKGGPVNKGVFDD